MTEIGVEAAYVSCGAAGGLAVAAAACIAGSDPEKVRRLPEGEGLKKIFEVAQTVATQPSAKTMAFDPKTHRIYLAAARAKPGQPRSYEPGSFVILVVGK